MEKFITKQTFAARIKFIINKGTRERLHIVRGFFYVAISKIFYRRSHPLSFVYLSKERR